MPIKKPITNAFLTVMLLALLAAGLSGAGGVPVVLDVASTNGQSQVDLAWMSDAGSFYEIYSTTNLAAGPWTLAVADPLASANLVGTMRLLSADKARFFQVRRLDTEGPAFVDRYPGAGAVGVGLFSTLSVSLSDVSGIDTNSCRLAVGGGTVLTNGCPDVTATPDGFSYAPSLAWGAFGSTVTVSFACLDLKGNATYSEWSFVLEVEPSVADNLLHLSTVQVAQKTDARSLMSLRPQPGVRFVGGLTLIAQTTNSLTFGYSGAHGLYAGAVLVSHDASNPFYRRIVSLADDPANGRVTAYTEDVPLTAIVKEGSFSPEVFIPVGGQMQALNFGADFPVSYDHDLAFGTTDWFTHVRLRPSKMRVKLNGDVGLSCQISDWQITALEAEFETSLDMEIRSGVDVYQKIDLINEPPLTLVAAPLGVVAGVIGPVPVWVEFQLGVDLDFKAKAEGAVSFYTGYDVSAYSKAALVWTQTDGLTHSYGGSYDVVPVPLDVPIKLSAEADFYLKPRLSALIYGAAGVSLDYRRGPCLTAEYRLGDPQCAITLSDRWSVNGTLTIKNKPDVTIATFLDDKNRIATWYWPEIPEVAPVFTVQPVGTNVVSGAQVTLAASASGSPAPAYQWYQNGAALPGKTAATLGFTMGASAVGAYHCVARNGLGSATSASALVALPASAPTGMAYVPAGSFQMGDTFTEGNSGERPVHTVFVSAFYMDKYEVTKAKWDEVANWAAANGYDINESSAAGKAPNHPAHSLTWFRAVKWCNACSQKEGLTPCYTVGGATYKSGDSAPDCNWTANGYRLPTEAEWEKAARGGLSGKRFPWGDTITHSQANYSSSTSYVYDTSPTRGYHSTYNDGTMPYTSPCGAFAANGYGLYDMADNVWEWCWDWYGSSYYSSSPGSEPRGPSSGSNRMRRGGSWYYSANGCRVAWRSLNPPTHSSNRMGFRPVRRAP